MARPIKHNWEDIKKHYEAGMSQTDIVRDFGCNKGALSIKIKNDGWIVNKQVNSYILDSIEVSKQKVYLQETDPRALEIADLIIDEKTKHLKLINDNATKLAGKISTMADQIDTPMDLKTLVDANDKLAITLKVADRHATSQVNVNTQNNLQVNKIVREFID